MEFNCALETAEYESRYASISEIPRSYLTRTPQDLEASIEKNIAKLGNNLLILGHHYQKDEVIKYANVTGDSLFLSKAAAEAEAEHIIFCGVHFMAETAAILTSDTQRVYLPDASAGCFMADMATREQVETALEVLNATYADGVLPITYVNSTAAIKAVVGANGGCCVTSTNAPEVMSWALNQGKRVLFIPDQHLGRNTAFKLGVKLDEMAVWDQNSASLSAENECLAQNLKVILWNGYCSVHQQFTVDDVKRVRQDSPETRIIVHPECRFEVVQAADDSGSTNKLIDLVEDAPSGASFAIGTDNNLVGRLKQQFLGEKEVQFLNAFSCPCVTMNRIRLPHLAWTLDNILAGNFSQQVRVDAMTTELASLALDKMFEL
jgi:quinolinate synthase